MTCVSYKRFFLMILMGLIFVQPTYAQSAPLESGQGAVLSGDYETAIAQYTSAASDPALQCDALYSLGSTLLRAQRLEEANTALTQQIDTCGASVRGVVMRGNIREQLGQPQEAFADYELALTLEPNPLRSYLYERMALIDTDNGVRNLRLASENERAPENKFNLRQKLADLYLLLGNSSRALAEYDAILAEMTTYITTLESIGAEFDKDGTRRALLEFNAASLEINLEQFDQGYARLQRIISTYPEAPAAFDALVKLINSAQDVDIVTRMRINIHNENYTPVVGVLTDYLPTAENPPAVLYLYLAQAQRGEGDVETALETLASISKLYPQDPIAPQALLEIARIDEANQDYTQAVEAYLNVATSYPQSPEAPDALLHAAELARDSLTVEQALQIYDQLGTQYPTSEQAKRGLFEVGMLLMSSDPQRAADFLGRVGTAEAYLWQGKVLQTSNPAAAQQAWTQATTVEPGTYFGMRACALLNNFDPFAQTGAIQQMAVTPEDKAAAAQWAAQTFGLGSVSADLSPELAASPMLTRALALWEAGFWTEARAELDTVHRLHRNDPAALLQLAFYYESIGLYRSSIFAALRLIVYSNSGLNSVPAGLVRLAYPIYYEDALIQEAQSNGLDPLLVASLIRQESSFDAMNISAADARGLMQLIPSTAADVAQQLSWPNYTVRDLLLPRVNIAFGSHYLASVRDFQEGSIIAALLSYNAGPTAAYNWVQASNGDIDRLHRVIAYDETRLYQEFLYENATIYQHFYRAAVPACMFGTPANTEA
jgi:soluble lytic murein transglycosylase